MATITLTKPATRRQTTREGDGAPDHKPQPTLRDVRLEMLDDVPEEYAARLVARFRL